MKSLIWNTLPTSDAVEALFLVDDVRLDTALKLLPLPNARIPDTLATDPTWEVGISTLQPSTVWLATNETSWRSWTGPRRRNGEDHHGPVFARDGDAVYTGLRECSCSTCQATVTASLRYC